ncbi:hypothetical protein JL100_028805 [Skermanella mucosa]|uniref:hypothetical protein n=1 Tax=Skermanella mucosa TaxID=1789672 RepID=UPI00192ACB5C|nr:hypothetical protein [Skermanella mucosa]UEM21015.1 hypothetical protein JL100_028805 [Skermanella mucosa]
MIRSIVMLALAATVLAGCANPRIEAAARANTALIGMPKELLYSCAGVPDRTQQVGDTELLTYVGGMTFTQVETDFDDIGIGGRRFIRPRTTVHRQNFQCEATFTMRDGIVESLDYNQGRDLESCGTIVETCVAVVPAPR